MSTRLSLTSYRDTWDYARIDPDAVALSHAQAEQLARLDDSVKRHIFSHYQEYLQYLLPEDRDYILDSIGRVETSDLIPSRGNPPSAPRPDLDGFRTSPLSDDEAATVLVETLVVVEQTGEVLRNKLRSAINRLDRSELQRLMTANIWSRWFLSKVIAPFIDEYAIALEAMGIDPEQIRAQSRSHQQARGKLDVTPSAPNPPSRPLPTDVSSDEAVPAAGATPAPANADTPTPPPTSAPAAPTPEPRFRAGGLPAALGAVGQQPTGPGSRPEPALVNFHPAAKPQTARPSATPDDAPAADTPATAAKPLIPAAPATPAVPPPSLPTTAMSPANRRPFSTTVVMGEGVIEVSLIDRIADSVPRPEKMKTVELVTSYGTLLPLTDAIEARLREDLPDAPFAAIGDPANASILPVITHPLGKSYVRAINNRVTIATTLLDRPDIAPHLAGALHPLLARLSLDTGRPLPVPADQPPDGGQRANTLQPPDHTPPQPPQTPSAAIAAAREAMHAPAQPSAPVLTAGASAPSDPTGDAVPATPPQPAPQAGPQAAPHYHAPEASLAPAPGPALTPASAPLPAASPTPSPHTLQIPASAPGTVFPGHAHPFPAATTQTPTGSPLPPPLTAGALPPVSSHRNSPTKASAPAPASAPPAPPSSPSRERHTSGLPSPAILIAPVSAAYDLIATGIRKQRKAAAARRAARSRCAPPPATQPKSTAVRSLLKVLFYSAIIITLATAVLFVWRVYQAPPSWLLAAPAQVRYVVPAYKALVPVFPTPEDARLARIDPGKTPTINPGARYPVIGSQGDVLQIAIIDPKGRPTAGWVAADLMRDVPSTP